MKGWTNNESFGDWSKVETTSAPPAPGLYKARVVQAEPAQTKTGKPSIKLTLELFEDGTGEELPRPRKVFDQLMLIPQAAWKIKLVCDALNATPPENNGYEAAEDFSKELVAAKEGCFVKIKHEDYEDRNGNARTSARVDRYLTESEVSDSATTTKSNGVSEPAARRPRRNADATAS